MQVGLGRNDEVERLNPTSCRVRNGHAALGAFIAYATPVKLVSYDLGTTMRVTVEGGKVQLSCLAEIITTYGQMNAVTYMLRLDSGDIIPAREAIVVDG